MGNKKAPDGMGLFCGQCGQCHLLMAIIDNTILTHYRVPSSAKLCQRVPTFYFGYSLLSLAAFLCS